MDHKKNPHSRRSKRQNKIAEDNFWDCSVCTYRNTAEAFKCLMCDVRKGTSTRKPRINPQLVAQQVAQQYTQSIPKVKKESALGGSSSSAGTPTNTSAAINTSNTPVSTVSAIPVSNVVSSTTAIASSMSLVVTSTATSSTSTVTTTAATAAAAVAAPSTTAAATLTTTSSLSTASSKVDVGIIAPANKTEKRYSPSVDGKSSSSTRRLRPKLKNVDRSSAEHKAVTVNNVTVIITEFQPKRHNSSSDQSGHHPSSGPTAPGFNHSSGSRGGVGGGGSGVGGSVGGVGTFQDGSSPAENGLHQDLSHKHQRVAL